MARETGIDDCRCSACGSDRLEFLRHKGRAAGGADVYRCLACSRRGRVITSGLAGPVLAGHIEWTDTD